MTYLNCNKIKYNHNFKIETRVVWPSKAVSRDAEGVRIKSQRSTKIYINYFEYISATLSQFFIQHDELG